MAYDSLDRSVMGVTDSELLPALKNWEHRLEEMYFKSSKLEESKKLVKSKSINMKEMLDALAPADRKRMMANYSQIIGFNKLVESGTVPSMQI